MVDTIPSAFSRCEERSDGRRCVFDRTHIGPCHFPNTPRVANAESKPKHYTGGQVECIVAIHSALSDAEWRGFCKGTAIAYLWRELGKGRDEDLYKTLDYVQWALKPPGGTNEER